MSILQDEKFSEKKNFEKNFGGWCIFLFIGQKNFSKKIRLRVGVWRWVCGGGRGVSGW